MASSDYRYTARPTRNPLRYLQAVWRLVVRDPETTTDEAAIVEIGFARSRLGRRFARWGEVVGALQTDPRTAPAMLARKSFGPIVLAELGALPEGTLGRVFADHCRLRGIDPNLVHVPPTDEVGWLLNHLYQTHDIWHVVTGWGNDLPGEVGLGGFYTAQLGAPPFFGYLFALLMLNGIFRRAKLAPLFDALSAGYQAGKRSAPLFGADWDVLFRLPLDEVRRRFAVDQTAILGEGIRSAA